MLRSIQILMLLTVMSSVWADSIQKLPIKLENSEHDKPKISIVVDDLGDNSIIGRKIASLPAALTLAILPHTPYAKKLSRIASEQGHEIIMHLPMEAFSRPDLLGPGALFSDMPQQRFLDTFLESAESIPNLVGFNNHMGSLLTQNSEKMSWLMDMAQQKKWYFLDSRTTQNSVAQISAEKIGLATIGRDIFLDHHVEAERLPEILLGQLDKSKKIARLKGHVVVICHPYPETFEFLSHKIPELAEEFELVRLSELLSDQKRILTAQKPKLSDQINSAR